jgi:hypothetical protein
MKKTSLIAMPVFNRCIEFALPGKGDATVTVKVLGDDKVARATRDALVEALATSGVAIADEFAPARSPRAR